MLSKPLQIIVHLSLSKFLVALLISLLLISTIQIPFAHAATTGATTVTQTVTGGSLTISSSASATLTSVSVNGGSAQTSTGNLGTVTATDNRGSGVGWSATATASNFTGVSPATKISGSNNTVTSGGTFTGTTGGTYTITIVTGGSVGTATFNVTGLETQGTTTTGVGVAIGTKGVTATFGAATYVTGDSWTIRGDLIPITGLTETPSVLIVISGLSTGVTVGAAHTYLGTSDAANLITATSGNGLGSYSTNPALSLSVPSSTFADTYTATVTETIQ